MKKNGAFLWLCLFTLISLASARADVVYTLRLSATNLSLTPGESRTVTWSVEPVNLMEHKVTWESENPYVASVDSRGKITAHAAGSTYIRATLETGASGRVTVKVSGNAVTELKLSVSTLELEVGGSAQLSYTMNDDADDKRVRWSSDDTSVATVDSSGNVKAVGGGVATITLLSVNGMTDTTVVYVPSDVKSVSLNEREIEIGIGQSVKLEATVSPINARNRTVSWESSDSSVASVSADGTVTGIGAGECKIGARSENGKYDVATVKVSILPEKIEFAGGTVVLSRENRNAYLEIIVTPAEASDCSISWYSSDESTVSVENGVLTAHSYGSAIISAEAKNGIKAQTEVFVSEAPEAVRLNSGLFLLPLDGEGAEVFPVFSPSGSMSKGYEFSVSDESIAKLEGEILIPLKAGVTEITVTTAEGLESSSEVRVYEDVKNLYPGESRVYIKQGECRQLSLYSETGRVYTGHLSARCDDDSVCVYAGGLIIGKRAGSVTLTFSSPGTSAVCQVNVTVIENSDYPTRVIALTFDNGPDKYTSEILSVLDKYGIKATFFLLGKNIEANTSQAALFKNTPHELGNHTYDNSSITSGSVASAAGSIEKTDKLATRFIERELTLLRAPDALLPETLLSSFLDTRRFVGRGYDMNDLSESESAEDIYAFAMSKAYNTCVLTFHEAGKNTARALELIIPKLMEQGYRFLTVSELIEYTGYESGVFSTIP